MKQRRWCCWRKWWHIRWFLDPTRPSRGYLRERLFREQAVDKDFAPWKRSDQWPKIMRTMGVTMYHFRDHTAILWDDVWVGDVWTEGTQGLVTFVWIDWRWKVRRQCYPQSEKPVSIKCSWLLIGETRSLGWRCIAPDSWFPYRAIWME
jgi:hypothetical protein